MREWSKNVVGRRERMKHGSGMKDRDERSRGIEILIPDVSIYSYSIYVCVFTQSQV